LRAAVPRLVSIARDQDAPDRIAAIGALCRLPEPAALQIYLTAIKDRDPAVRRAGETALMVIRDKVAAELAAAVRSKTYAGPAGLALERVVARFEPIGQWRVIGPFPRTTPQVFLGARSIDFRKPVIGALGRSVSWTDRSGDPATGRVDLEDLKRYGSWDGLPIRPKTTRSVGSEGLDRQPTGNDGARFGYDRGTSPDLGAFAYAEIDSDRTGPALLLLGSSGSLIVTVNEKLVHQYTGIGGRAFEADSDCVPIDLSSGRNRIMVLSRQGIGAWCFSAQLARSDRDASAFLVDANRVRELRRYAMENSGDRARGERLFFDDRGAGCARCHAVGSRGTATIGPNLAGSALTYDRAELIRSVLEPSSRIALGYQSVIVATRDGKVLTGVIRAETESSLEIADSLARITRLSQAEIRDRQKSEFSVMPARAAEMLTPDEFADLVGYLASLKDIPRTARLPAGATSPKIDSLNPR
jgi:putative heme-binding domain-containing protein